MHVDGAISRKIWTFLFYKNVLWRCIATSSCCSQCIDGFKASQPRVVDKLHELKNCSDYYRNAATSTGDDLPGETQMTVDAQVVSTACGTDGSSVSANSCEVQTQNDNETATTSCGTTCNTDDTAMTEQELKEKHDKVCVTVASFHDLTATVNVLVAYFNTLNL